MTIRESKQTGDELPEMPGLNSVWRLEGSRSENVAVWQEAATESNVLLTEEQLDASNYLGDVRCEFGDKSLTTPPWNQIHIVLDLLVMNTATGPKVCGVRLE